MIQLFASSFMHCMSIDGIDNLLLKTLAFLSFQFSQVMRMIAVFNPFLEEDCAAAKAFQYSQTAGLTTPRQVNRSWHLIHEDASVQNSSRIPAFEKDVSSRFKLDST